MYNEEDILVQQIIDFRKKLYQKSLYKGIILFCILIISSFITFNVLEYFGQFNSIIRSLFFFSFVAIAVFALVKYIALPSYYYINRTKELNDLRTAELMGKGFPNVKDKLVNYLQLLQQAQNNELALEALNQKRSELKNVSFIKSIKFDEIHKYLKYSTIPLVVLLGILLLSPAIFSEGSTRIINYNRVFVAAAPFQFNISNASLKAFQNEDLALEVSITGKALPEHVYVVYNGRKIKLE
ncbi:MAG TPA: hypothetical protein VL947_11800, partial [Cytophagales bacterium]|nr:hypothetical protein [Cytophagales bacterium]